MSASARRRRGRAGRGAGRAASAIVAGLTLGFGAPGATDLARAQVAEPAPPADVPAPAQIARAPRIQAEAAILVERSTGEVVHARAPDRPLGIASTTKLMTALIVLERTSLGTIFTAPRYLQSFPDESLIRLGAGERMTVRDLLRGLLLASGNDAALALARGTDGSGAAFVATMNRRARELGLRRTHYTNPVGLDAPRNYSSARDLAALTRVLLDRPFFARTVDLPRARLSSDRRSRTVFNRNDLVFDFPFVNGVKTGFTPAAGYILVVSGSRAGVSMISVVLGEPSRFARNADTVALLRYGLARYRRLSVLRRRQTVATAAVRYRERDRVRLVAARSVWRVVRRGDRPRLTVDAPDELAGPLPAGRRVGSVTVVVRGRAVDRVALVTAAPVPAVGVAERFGRFILRPDRLVLALAVVAGTLAAVQLRRRERRRREGARRIGSPTA